MRLLQTMRLRKDRAPRHDVPHHATPADDEAGRDIELGRIFRHMRAAMKASRESIARRLAVAVATIDTLEAGAVGAFPNGRETERIVRVYCELLRMDPEPILWRVGGRPSAPSARGRPARIPRPMPPVRTASARDDAAGQRWSGRRRALIAPRRDGLRWVDVGDPRVRKANKLPPVGR